jgi:hypothetical protein
VCGLEAGGSAGACSMARRAARLAAETGMAVFRIAFERWVTDAGARPWTEHLHMLTTVKEAPPQATPSTATMLKPAAPSRSRFAS